MSERRAPAHAAAAGESLAAMSDHLGQLLSHADRLLREWEEHAEEMRVRFEAEARSAGEVLRKTLEAALTEVAAPSRLTADLARAQRAAIELDGAAKKGNPGARPAPGEKSFADLAREVGGLREEIARRMRAPSAPKRDTARLTLVLALSANALVLATIVIVLLRNPGVVVKEVPAQVTSPPVAAALDAGLVGPVPPDIPPVETPPDACASVAVDGQGAVACVERLCATPGADGKRQPPPAGCEWKPFDKRTKRSALACKLPPTNAPRILVVEWPGPCPR